MLTRLTKKDQREHLKELLKFCKENSTEMYNFMLMVKRIRSGERDRLKENNKSEKKVKGCGEYVEDKKFGDFVCGKNYLCDKCKENSGEDEINGKNSINLENMDWNKVEAIYMGCDKCGNISYLIKGEELYCESCGNNLLKENSEEEKE